MYGEAMVELLIGTLFTLAILAVSVRLGSITYTFPRLSISFRRWPALGKLMKVPPEITGLPPRIMRQSVLSISG